MFVMNIIKKEESGRSSPKYLILLASTTNDEMLDDIIFHYLISPNAQYINNSINFPAYFITPYLRFMCFGKSSLNTNLDLSKLGTDYIVNGIGSLYQDECKGSYPDNYVFVIEPSWPIFKEYRTDRTPLKRSY